ncbi:P-loop containing nucleoside triphosphate hydrolase protein [Aspergillus cavernicola]|uniref:P-loop containing nucleoside triphosphate hydrolase protein n=1 Tax=Aspergillus cavernicola TaxID=176166 RepID=A0ABR4ICM9_9EURO
MSQYLQQQVQNLLAFAGASRSASDAIFIAVMGVTGAGKSTFVSQCTGHDVDVGHGLLSCTSEVAVFDCKVDGRTVYLIDTPGFDDSNFSDRPDFAILQSIAAYLSASYSQNIRIHGVIFLHRITENRVTGSARRNIELMKALCGPDYFPHVALATTHWSTTRESVSKLRDRERLLQVQDAFFKPLLSGGATMFRHDDEAASACRMVRHLINIKDQLGGRVIPPLALQRELVDESKRLDRTAAGRVVMDAAARKFAEAKGEIEALKRAIKQADKVHAETLRQMKEENELIVRTIEKTRENMAIRTREIAQREQELVMRRLDQAHARSKAELAAHEAQLAELEDQVRQLRREAYAAKQKREYGNYSRHENDCPPSYQEAVGEKQAQVAEKQAVVAVAQQRTLEEDILIATIPAMLAAIAPAALACSVM